MEIIESKVKLLIDSRGLKQKWIAGQIGVDYSYLNYMIIKKRRVPAAVMLALSELLNINPDEYFKNGWAI